MNAIDLGQNPVQPDTLPTPAAPAEPNYPTLHLDGGPELHKIPDKGKSIIHHEVISKSFNQKGKKRTHSISMKIKKIQPMMPKSNPSAGDESAMSGLMNSAGE